MRELPDASVDAVVTDPPYELGFMGKSWDSSGIAFNTAVWAECLRVLKPGGHLLAFGGSRTWHRIAVAVDDAGFQIRDSVAWLYGSGFPKSLDVSKAIDKAAGVERNVVTETVADIFGEREKTVEIVAGKTSIWNENGNGGNSAATDPATHEARKWQGWGTALKPAFEPVIVARKPLVGTVAANVLEFGTGALNIDGTRIGTGTGETKTVSYPDISGGNFGQDSQAYSERANVTREVLDRGRWPSNVVLDEFTAGLVDEQSGVSKDGVAVKRNSAGKNIFSTIPKPTANDQGYGDSGGASRFFYVAKASKRDRNEGLDALDVKSASELTGRKENSKGLSGSTEHGNSTNPYANGGSVEPRQNFHPTVKPTDLMRQLVRLVTPPGGVVLDPFTGSGSTGKAAILEGFEFIGCELTKEYLPIIEGRLNHAVATVKAEQDKEKEKLF
jgi:site-specific DNA-methyltransferase (adenine-specific)